MQDISECPTANGCDAAYPGPDASAITDWLIAAFAKTLNIPADRIDPRVTHDRNGMDSLAAISISAELGLWLGKDIPPADFFSYPTIELMAEALSGGPAGAPKPPASVAAVQKVATALGIVGLAARFAGADNARALGERVRAAAPAITAPPSGREAELSGLPAGGFLHLPEGFDHDLFGLSRSEASWMDPQQQLLLETVWRALEDAMIPVDALKGGRTGVYVGLSDGVKSGHLSDSDLLDPDMRYLMTGASRAVAANRISHVLDLRGPCVSIDTACSASLTALHYARADILAGVTDSAIVAGVALIQDDGASLSLAAQGALAPDGACRAFIPDANGMVRGEGCGVVILMSEGRARHLGVPIGVLLQGTAVGQDGRTMGLMSPNGQAQDEVILAALHDAGVQPHQIDYVETHGTGTALGDQIELASLSRVFGDQAGRTAALTLGALKPLIGHTEAAAGIAGVIKVTQMLMAGRIAPMPGDGVDCPPGLRAVKRETPWPKRDAKDGPRRASVSAFSFGGSNAHAVLAAPPDPPRAVEKPRVLAPPYPVILSAPDDVRLKDFAVDLHAALSGVDASALLPVCRAITQGRTRFSKAAGLVVSDFKALKRALAALAEGRCDEAVLWCDAGSGFGPIDPAALPLGPLISLPVFSTAAHDTRAAIMAAGFEDPFGQAAAPGPARLAQAIACGRAVHALGLTLEDGDGACHAMITSQIGPQLFRRALADDDWEGRAEASITATELMRRLVVASLGNANAIDWQGIYRPGAVDAATGPLHALGFTLPGTRFKRKPLARTPLTPGQGRPRGRADPVPEAEPPRKVPPDIVAVFESSVKDMLGLDAVPGDKTLLELGADSMMLVAIAQRLSDAGGPKIDFAAFVNENPTIAVVRDRLAASTAGPTKSPGLPDGQTVSPDDPFHARQTVFGGVAEAGFGPLTAGRLENGAGGTETPLHRKAQALPALAQPPADLTALLRHQIDTMAALYQDQLRALANLGYAPPKATGADSAIDSATGESLQLSAEQRPLVQLAEIDPDAMRRFNIALVLTPIAAIDTAMLDRALRTMIARHAVLRAGFDRSDAQTVLQDVPVAAQTRAAPFATADAFLRWVKDTAAAPFDRRHPPLLRCNLADAPDGPRILLVTHHLAMDAFGLMKFAEELDLAYAAFVGGGVPDFPEAAEYSSEIAASNAAPNAEDAAYWQSFFASYPGPQEYPIDFPRPSRREFHAAHCHHVLAPDLVGKCNFVAGQKAATLSMLLAATLGCVMRAMTGDADIRLGLETRPPGDAPSVVHKARLAVLRADLSQAVTFLDVLDLTRKAMLAIIERPALPYERLMQLAWPNPSPDRPYPVAVTLNMLPPRRDGQAFNTDFDAVRDAAVSTQFELTLNVTFTGKALNLDCIYDPDLFATETVEAFLQRLELALARVVENPNRPLADIVVPTAAETTRLLNEFNAPEEDGAEESSFVVLFNRVARKQPGEMAVIGSDGTRLDYASVARRSDDLARTLAARLPDPGRIVGVLTRRTSDLIVLVLALMKARLVYMPLDPDSPARRLAGMLARSGAVAVIHDADTASLARDAAEPAPEMVLLPLDRLGADVPDAALPASGDYSADDVAYVLHTSGSTGTPKAAQVTMRGMVNHMLSKIADCQIDATSVVAQNSHQCFDVSIWQMLTSLLVGGTTAVISEQSAAHPREAMNAIADLGVSVFEAVPPFLALMLEEGGDSRAAVSALGGLKSMVATGEALPPALCRQWLGLFPTTPLLNAYGPTECSDDVASHLCAVPPSDRARSVPIGRPIRNTQLYVTDADLRLLPLGAVGELCVGGKAVGPGYLNDRDRTSVVFRGDPFRPGPNRSLYRTGDLARWRVDGALEFLGRADRQIQAAGRRIEPAEIEAALSDHPDTLQAAVTVAQDAVGQPVLHAHVVSAPDRTLTQRELRRTLSVVLPRAMTPRQVFFHAALPVLPSGKIDRAALGQFAERQAKDAAVPDPKDGPDAQGLTERGIVDLWAQVLGHRDFSRNDDFFEVGGRSLDALDLINRVRHAFDVWEEAHLFLRPPTVRAMAKVVERLRGQDGATAGQMA